MSGVLVLGLIEAALAAAAFAVCRQPAKAAALLILVTAPLEVYRTSFLGNNVSLFRLSVAIGVITILATPELRGRVVRFARANAWPLLLYAALTVLVVASILVGGADNGFARRLALIIPIGAVAAVTVAVLLRGSSIRTVALMVCAAALLPVLLAGAQGIAARSDRAVAAPLVSHLPVDGLSKARQASANFAGSGARTKATFGDPNHYAAFLVVPIAVALALFLCALARRSPPATIAAAGVVVALAASSLSSFSRTGWLGAGVAVIVTLLLLRRAGLAIPVRRRSVVLSAIVVLAVSAPLIPTIVDRVSPSSSLNEASDRGHRETASAAIDAFADRPVFGIGTGELGQRLGQGPLVTGAHSSYLTVLGENGIVGMLLLMGAAIAVLTALGRGYARAGVSEDRVLASALLAGYLGLLASNITYDLWWDDFHWVIIGLALWSGHAFTKDQVPATASS